MPRVGYDFDGVITAGYKPDLAAVVITGRPVNAYFSVIRPYALQCPVYCFPDWRPSTQEEAALWKVEMIKKLKIEKFFEDDPYQLDIIVRNCPDVEVIKV